MAVIREFDTAAGVVTVPPSNVREGLPVRLREPGELASARTVDNGTD